MNIIKHVLILVSIFFIISGVILNSTEKDYEEAKETAISTIFQPVHESTQAIMNGEQYYFNDAQYQEEGFKSINNVWITGNKFFISLILVVFGSVLLLFMIKDDCKNFIKRFIQ